MESRIIESMARMNNTKAWASDPVYMDWPTMKLRNAISEKEIADFSPSSIGAFVRLIIRKHRRSDDLHTYHRINQLSRWMNR